MKLIIINGAPGVGKTTVGRLVYSQLKNSAFLDGDEVWRINPFEVNEKTKGIVENNINFVLRNYFVSGYEHVVLAWVLHHQSIIDRLINQLDSLKPEIHILTLVADEDALLDRLKADTEITRSPAIAKDRLRQSLILESKKIDTTGVKPEETAWSILSIVNT